MSAQSRFFARHVVMISASAAALASASTAPVHAQALQPVVDVCTGITLPRSAVTEVIGAVNQPLVNSLQTRVNALTNVQILGLPLLNLPDLNIDLTSILADAAAGDPISLQILDTDGNIIGASDDCNVGADAFTLNQQGGISIGGNSITGLGANGQAATAGELSAIAFGNNASTAVGATGAVAIGTGASVTAANGVAIGAGSLADRGAQTGYTAPFVTGTSNSIGSVSVGSTGGLRQITNLAPGTTSSDAATVGQVQGAFDAVGDLAALAVQYNDATQATVTLGGAGGTTIDNLAPGALGAASTQAVNGSQLFATNQQVGTNTAAIASLDGRVSANTTDIGTNTAAITALDGRVTTNTTNIAGNTTAITALDGRVTTNTGAITALDAAAVQYDDATHQTVTFDGAGGTRLTSVSAGALGAASTDAVNGSQLFSTNQQVAGNTTAIGANTTAITALDGRVTTNTGAITAIDARVTTNTGSIAALDAAAVQYNDASHQLITLDGAGGTRITNVLAGAVNATSTDAVNGAQLDATNQQIANLTNSGIQYDDPSRATVTFAGAAGTLLTNVTAGTLSATSSDAVNGSQLFATNQAVGAIDARVTLNTTAITNLDTRLTATQAAVANAVQYDDATQTQITLGGAGGTTISNVAPGALGAASTDAVNGAQLFATNQQVGANTTAITGLDGRVTTNTTNIANNTTAITSLDGRVTTNTTNITALDGRVTTNTTNIAANTTAITDLDGRVTTNTTNITNLDGRVTTNTTDIANLDGRVTTNTTNIAANTTDIANLDGRVTTNTTNITSLDGRVTTNTTDIANLDGRVTNNTTSITSLDGRVTTNTTNIANLDGRVTNNSTTIAAVQEQVNNVPVRFVADGDGTTPSATPTNTAALTSASGGATRLTNVAPGTLSAASTDAVNGSQLFATNQQVGANTTAITQLSTTLAGAPRSPVQYSNAATPTVANGGTPSNDVTLIGATPGAPVALHNVANGTLANDATNLGQLQNGLAAAISTSRTYTDTQIASVAFDLADLGQDVSRLRRNAFSGTAAAMAVAGIPQTMEVGKSMVGGAVGHYRGRTAFAIGASTTLGDEGQAVVKAGATMDTNGKGGFSAGAGFAF